MPKLAANLIHPHCKIIASDEVTAGNGHIWYGGLVEVNRTDNDVDPKQAPYWEPFGHIRMQTKPLRAGRNGWTNEELIAILMHRLRAFQQGDFPSDFNQEALTHLERAYQSLTNRTVERRDRGVEGELKP